MQSQGGWASKDMLERVYAKYDAPTIGRHIVKNWRGNISAPVPAETSGEENASSSSPRESIKYDSPTSVAGPDATVLAGDHSGEDQTDQTETDHDLALIEEGAAFSPSRFGFAPLSTQYAGPISHPLGELIE